jgi:predicted O-methyltransferase YrrM
MWDKIKFDPDWLPEIRKNFAYCETLREKAEFNTGSISEKAAMCLRGLTEHFKPRVVVEVGTFIGNSTLSMKAGHIYTCDMSNACFRDRPNITTFPGKSATEMFSELWHTKKLLVDLFFFDGRIQVHDLPLILSMSHKGTVYVFDDYEYTERFEKGMINWKLLKPFFEPCLFFEPYNDLPGEGLSTVSFAVSCGS